MSKRSEQADLVKLWLSKAEDSLESAALELDAGHVLFAVNRLYYACFYAITALLLSEGKQFARHASVLAEFNRAWVKTGRVDRTWGSFAHSLFDDRQQADYLPAVIFTPADTSGRLDQARRFVALVRGLMGASS
ncbi:MAG TPA: HEPN domain-containing protein [Phycisphaerae bacterium]|nr:HEPN domain-containing protein [Phycisphaerae bacterium]